MFPSRNLLQVLLLVKFPRLLSRLDTPSQVTHAFMGNTSNRTMSKEVIPAAIPKTHVKARGTPYPRTEDVERFPVPADKVAWDAPYPEYLPRNYTAPSVTCQPVWADIDVRTEEGRQPQFNTIDDGVDRRSHMGPYKVVSKVPRNPVGRTGVCGRGLLGRWGPNHAADPIVTRWKYGKGGQKEKDLVTSLPILQFIAIQRRDSGQWALPGGMVDPGENVSMTLKREFEEEAMNWLEATSVEKQQIQENVTNFFSENGKEVYRGYVDDPRNTDNSWMETVAYNFHDETGLSVGRFKLHAGDDAVGVRWTDISSSLMLYASHIDFLYKTAELHKAHW